MKNKRKRVACLLLAVLCVIQLFVIFSVSATAAGETAVVSNVLDDLKRDPDFKEEDYPENPKDHSVQVIQVAEGVNGELFVYVYRPEGTDNVSHRADSINMSLINPAELDSLDEVLSVNDPSFIGPPLNQRYSLVWLNSSQTLEKYQVFGFEVSSDPERYYNIAAIYRPFDDLVDLKEDESWDDYTDYKGFGVGLCWHFYYNNGALVNEAKKVDLVDVDIEVVGFVELPDGFKFYVDKCHAHYVGFNVVNYDVKHIYDADVTYKTKSKTWQVVPGNGETITYGNEEGPFTEYITDKDDAWNDADGWLAHEFKWNRIVTKEEFFNQIDDFKNENDYVENVVTDNKGKNNPWTNVQYVFQFLETDYSLTSYGGVTTENSTYLYEVGILRLHFLTPKGVYNLGVVSDVVSDDGEPDIVVGIEDMLEKNFNELWEWFEKILQIIGLLLVLVFFAPFITPIISGLFRLVWSALETVFKILFKILMAPFKIVWRFLFHKKE